MEIEESGTDQPGDHHIKSMWVSRKRPKEKTKQSDVVAGKRVAMLLLKAHSGLNNTEILKRLNVLVVTVSMTLADEGIQGRMKDNIERIRISET